MAKIIIKRREFPIIIENERAKKLRDKWLDQTTPRSDLVSIDNWSGSYGDIKIIELDPEPSKTNPFFIPEVSPEEKEKASQKAREYLESLRKQP